MATIEVKVPDIGGFADVPVIEVFVKPGDAVKPEDPLVTLESDKATMDVPSPSAGTVKEVRIKVGDKVAEGSLILLLDAAGAAPLPGGEERAARESAPLPAGVGGDAPTGQPWSGADAPPGASAPAGAASGAPVATAPAAPASGYAGKADVECDMLVLGAGPGGYSAAFRAADLGMKTVIVERYATLGGVCLNVGCIPSKALLHVAAIVDETKALAEHGIAFGTPAVDLAKLRGWKDKVVGKLTGGLAGMARTRKVTVVRGLGQFLDAHHLEVELTEGPGQAKTGAKQVVKFAQAIIAAGSQVVRLPFIPEDPRILDSTRALDLASVPKRMLVIGGGIIGLEMGTVYSTLGARLDVVEMMDGLMPGADRDLVRVWEKMNKHRFERIMLKTKTVAVEAKADAVYATFEGDGAPSGPQPYDAVLMSVGRAPNGKKIAAERAGVTVTDRGFISVDSQMRTNVAHIFAIGDIAGNPMLAHKAVHEGHVAAEAAAGSQAPLRRPRRSVRRLYRSRDCLGRPHGGRGEGEGNPDREGRVPVGGLGACNRQRPRRGAHQAAVRRRDASHRRRRHRRDARGRPDRRDRAGDRDGRGHGGHRPHDPSAPDARRDDRHRGRGGRRHLHRPAPAAQALTRERPGRYGAARSAPFTIDLSSSSPKRGSGLPLTKYSGVFVTLSAFASARSCATTARTSGRCRSAFTRAMSRPGTPASTCAACSGSAR